MNAIPWGDMPYDNREVADVIYDYAVIRGDLVEQYARDQLSTWIERLVRQRQAEAYDEGSRARCPDPDRCWCDDYAHSPNRPVTPNPYRATTRGAHITEPEEHDR